jgi:hypothetical protein
LFTAGEKVPLTDDVVFSRETTHVAGGPAPLPSPAMAAKTTINGENHLFTKRVAGGSVRRYRSPWPRKAAPNGESRFFCKPIAVSTIPSLATTGKRRVAADGNAGDALFVCPLNASRAGLARHCSLARRDHRHRAPRVRCLRM